MMYNDQLVYKLVIWAFFGINLSAEKEGFIQTFFIVIIVKWYNC